MAVWDGGYRRSLQLIFYYYRQQIWKKYRIFLFWFYKFHMFAQNWNWWFVEFPYTCIGEVTDDLTTLFEKFFSSLYDYTIARTFMTFCFSIYTKLWGGKTPPHNFYLCDKNIFPCLKSICLSSCTCKKSIIIKMTIRMLQIALRCDILNFGKINVLTYW